MAGNTKSGATKGISSERPRRVARDVISKLQSGEKPVMKEILAAHGYAKSTQVSPHQVTSLPSFKDEMDSYVARLEKERTRVLAAMESKPLGEVEYKDLVEATKKMTHDVQLLTGGKTENRGVEEDRNTLVMIMRDIRGELPAPPIQGEVISVDNTVESNYVGSEDNGQMQVPPEALQD